MHQSGIPWNDASGKELRKWLNISDKDFYDNQKVAIIPMGFCYPGKGTSGDKPPRKECAQKWHLQLLNKMPNLELILLIGSYAQKYYLKNKVKKTLTATVDNYPEYLPTFFTLPHPSPRNRFWFTKKPWFKENVVPVLQIKIKEIIHP